MAKLNTLFDTFLSNIEPNSEAVKYAKDAHTYVRECLEQNSALAGVITGSFLYGSYKRHTAVGDIKDVDIVILTNLDTLSEENQPQKVLRRFKSALAKCYDDPETPEYQRRSIRIDEPLPDNKELELTLDIIPAVVITGPEDALLVPDREAKKWIFSHPRGHLKRTTELNSDDYSNGRYIPLVKIMKWWWKYQCGLKYPDVERPKPKGFWVECLTGENFDPSQTCWADHFITVLQNVSDKYSHPLTVPDLDDPGLPGEKIKTSMKLEEFQAFMETINESLKQAVQARDESDETKSSEIWREVFGEEFPILDAEEGEETRKAAQVVVLGSTSHARPLPWPYRPDKRAKVRLDAFTYIGDQRKGGINSNGRVLPSGINIKFLARTNARDGYQIFWQVVNTGKHAESCNALRGGFFRGKTKGNESISSDQHINWESTQYTGKHWIECFVVYDDVCIARSGKFFVTVRNTNFVG